MIFLQLHNKLAMGRQKIDVICEEPSAPKKGLVNHKNNIQQIH